ncbi:MAG: GGDEF domain-containing protein, partial [Alphaproteobacteria bacterium]|nr:GGDEF domain-containing protein [Alphaproteobacteria bacterium]
ETERRQKDCDRQLAELERLALTDALTGVLNRRGVEQVITTALAAARRYDERGVLALIDLDGPKLVNDTYGHVVGAIVLKQVARVLTDNVRETDHVGRIGGDEFVVLLTRVPWEDGLNRAHLLDQQLNSTAVNIDGWTIMLRASVGTQVYGSGDDGEMLLSLADSAMYKAKETRSDRSNPAPAD